MTRNHPIKMFTAAALCCFVGAFSSAQAQDDAETASPVKIDQTKVVRAIFDATKSAKTVSDFTAFLEQCNTALGDELSQANRDYVVSLTGWGLNRRGEKRYELAKQLKKIGNQRFKETMDQAMADFNQAIVADPTRVRTWMSRGVAHVESERLDNAIRDFTQVTELKTDDASGWFNRAETLYQRGNYRHAIKDYDVVLRLDSDDVQALTGRGLSKLKLTAYDESLVDFERVIELQPKTQTAYINRGDALQGLEQWDAARKDYDKAILLEETGVAFQRAAWLHATCPEDSIRNEELARQRIDRAVELAGETPAVLDALAATEALEGNFDSAKTHQQQAIGLVSGQEDAGSPYQARLIKYENSEPFLQVQQAVVEEDVDSKPAKDSATEPPAANKAPENKLELSEGK
ncbi:MAG: tetratricopeptide (TPR) repeat protein [Mariniblastus sp.]|jgi:tetratricopeptide (TPR) repeat protein